MMKSLFANDQMLGWRPSRIDLAVPDASIAIINKQTGDFVFRQVKNLDDETSKLMSPET
jgi:hypothetical protein